jgi:RNA polymerase sigma-70 factor (ECF subfamily)
MPNWDQIVAQHGPTAVRQVRRILGAGPDADDVVQEVFVEVLRLWEERHVRNWGGLLCQMASNRALDLLRRRRTSQPLNDVEVSDPRDGPLEAAIAEELAERLRQAICQLPDRQATVFSLRYFGDQSYEQIAETLGIDSSAVGTALHKARTKLNLLLEHKVKGAS